MAEPRARIRQKGPVFHSQDLAELLYCFGDNPTSATNPQTNHRSGTSLASTVACLDEILTDFIIETCHAAALSASYSRRQKIKVDDFKFVLRKDEALLGRVLEQLWREKVLKDSRRALDIDKLGNEGVGELEGLAAMGGVGGADMNAGKRRRRRKRKADGELEEGGGGGGGGRKRVA
jgi:transcription initiation factor TFIID subunit 13